MSLVNPLTADLAPYPMEELTKTRERLVAAGITVYDFGTGDPKIPLWPKISDALAAAITPISQYPSIKGSKELLAAQASYLARRFHLEVGGDLTTIPTMGSKEAVFHMALSMVGRLGRRTIVYPDPGYPVYHSSTIFAQGRPYPVRLKEEDGYQLKPWLLPKDVQKDTAAVWVNYPHNPTGAVVGRDYWVELIKWAQQHDVVILSDDCYADLYESSLDENTGDDQRPMSPLQISSDRVLSFFSLSKRSGMTGYRSGMIAGDPKILEPHLRARANFGLGAPQFIQAAAAVAWRDDEHVKARRDIFSARMALAGNAFIKLGMLDEVPKATFYLWCRLPKNFPGDDISFALGLAEQGVICTPAQWLGEASKDYVRFALVPNDDDTKAALTIVEKFIAESS